MGRWNKKEEGEEENKPIETEEAPLAQKKEVLKESDVQRAFEEKAHEVAYQINKGMEWASNLSGTVRRALEDRTPLMVTERDLDALDFYTVVLSYTSPEALAKVFLELEQEERAKIENDVSVS